MLIPQGKSETNNNTNIYFFQDFINIPVSYEINQLVKPNA